MKKNELVKKFGKEKRWVNYRLVEMKGRMTKIPYSIDGKKASSVDDKSWSTFDEAKKASENVGIVFTPKQDLLGIDIDHCLDLKTKNITHEQKEKIADFILEADTYTEISPSGEGLHLFLSITGGEFALESNKSTPFECYTSGRYFTFTGNIYGESKKVKEVTIDEAKRLLLIIGYPWKKTEEPKNEKVPVNRSTDSKLSDKQVLEKMFASKGGEKLKALYEGSLKDHKDDASSADMALCSHLAFWTGKDHAQVERIWLASPLGSRKKTQERMDYRQRTVNAAIASCKSIFETGKMKMEREHPDLDLLYVIMGKGEVVYLQNTENICRVLRNHPDFSGRFRYDAFKNVYEIKTEKGQWRPFEDNDAVHIQTLISIRFPEWFGRVGKEMVNDAMVKVAKENEFDSAKDYITSLTWDKMPRLDSWLSKVYGVPEDIYHKSVASNWMKGLVKRIVEPGCKFDYVLVLEGEQGSRKSTSLAILGKNWHVETAMSTDSKDFFMQFQGKAIVEFSEGETLSRTEVKRMKAIITMQSDKYRPPYERTSQDFPRRCVFAMTTNQSEYLKDETGNRRWLPVTVLKPEADVKWLEENRDQLFAEAYHRVEKLGETTYDFPKAETLAAQRARRIHDPNTEMIYDWYQKLSEKDRQEGVTVYQVFRDAIHAGWTPGKGMTKHEEMSIAGILKEVLNLEPKRSMTGGMRSNKWYPKIKFEVVPEDPKLTDEENARLKELNLENF